MSEQSGPRTAWFVLASASPARLATLRSAGLDPEVIVSGVDESAVAATDPAALAQLLATDKCRTVFTRSRADLERRGGRGVVVGCDSVLELDGRAYGKPGDAATARERLRLMSGRSGVLHTGHHVIASPSGEERAATASTVVEFADLSDSDIDAYVETGEPLQVAGAFTIDGLGGAFVRGVVGDPHNVVGISLPLLRVLVGELGIDWPLLWTG